MKNKLLLPWLIGLAAVTHAWAHDEPTPSSLEVQLRKPEDTATVRQQAGRTLVRLHSPSGIGSATVIKHKKAAAWPEHLEIEIPLRGLEGLTLHARNLVFVGSVPHDRPTEGHFALRLPDGKEEPLDSTSPFWPALTGAELEPSKEKDDNPSRPVRRYRFQLTPALLNAAGDTLTIEWVDFYR